MRCYIANGLIADAEDVFYRVMKAGGFSAAEEKVRPCSPDVTSWNIMIDG
jgi:pentatricopeptide repeat protein